MKQPLFVPPLDLRARTNRFFRSMVFTGARRNLAVCGTNQGNWEKKICSPSEGWWKGEIASGLAYYHQGMFRLSTSSVLGARQRHIYPLKRSHGIFFKRNWIFFFNFYSEIPFQAEKDHFVHFLVTSMPGFPCRFVSRGLLSGCEMVLRSSSLLARAMLVIVKPLYSNVGPCGDY